MFYFVRKKCALSLFYKLHFIHLVLTELNFNQYFATPGTNSYNK